jgi:hypothetical protein
MSGDTNERHDEATFFDTDELEIVTYDSLVDGALVVEIGVLGLAEGRHLRVYINEGVVFDRDPEAAS